MDFTDLRVIILAKTNVDPNNGAIICDDSIIPDVMYSYLVHLVCGAVLADSNRDGGLVWQGYPQFYVCHSIVVL